MFTGLYLFTGIYTVVHSDASQGSDFTSKGQATIIKARIKHCTLFALYRLGLDSIVGVSLMLNHDLWFANNKQPYEGISVSLLF